ncbi:unnamed protein product [Rotaria magnacalcarata]|uniref:Vitelline membrane outer layer protein 1 homolog n=2 Tax=Rotaria magnacalcarata TaxID=392030 RepID=A0A816EU14_9BILA|nr:unnamed protein product [Rotaria magnacalcarata]
MLGAIALVVSITGIIMFSISSNSAAITIMPVSTKVTTETVTTNYMTILTTSTTIATTTRATTMSVKTEAIPSTSNMTSMTPNTKTITPNITTITTNMTPIVPDMDIIANHITKMTTKTMSIMMSPTTLTTKIITSATTTTSTTTTISTMTTISTTTTTSTMTTISTTTTTSTMTTISTTTTTSSTTTTISTATTTSITTTTSKTSQSVSQRNDIVSELQPYVDEFGDFHEYEYCPEGSWAYGLKQRIQYFQFRGDDTALNAISLYCRKHDGTITGSISSFEGLWGYWSNSAYCGNETGVYMFSAAFKIEDFRGPSYDHTSANDFRSQCWNGTVVTRDDLHATNGQIWGSWKRPDTCNKGSAICGISSKFLNYSIIAQDDIAMSGAFFKCCSL